MSLFNRKESPKKPIVPAIEPTASKPVARGTSGRQSLAPSSPTATLVAAKSVVEGEITGNAELVIEGKVIGDIRLDSKVTVGPEGFVKGSIHADSVIVGGKIHGDVHGRERVQLLASGRLEGDVVSPGFEIEKGGFFQGQADMSRPSNDAGSKKSTAPGQRSPAAAGRSAAEPNSKREAGKPGNGAAEVASSSSGSDTADGKAERPSPMGRPAGAAAR